MDEIWEIIQKYPKTYIVTISLVATVILINESLDFAERVSKNMLLLSLSIIIFYFFARILIEEKINAQKQKR